MYLFSCYFLLFICSFYSPLFHPHWAELEARLNASDLEGQVKRVQQLQRESKGNTTSKSIINGQQSGFPPHLRSPNLTSWFISDWLVEVMKYLFPHPQQIELNARLTDLGNKLGDVEAEVKALQLADQGKLTAFTLHRYLHQCICNAFSIKGRRTTFLQHEAHLWNYLCSSSFIPPCNVQMWKSDWMPLTSRRRRKKPWWHNYSWKLKVR